MRQRAFAVGAMSLLTITLTWLLFAALPRWYAPAPINLAPTTVAQVTSGRKIINARLFYLSEDGTKLTGVERDVPYSEDATDQAREIITAQLAPVVEPLVSAVPPGTTLRNLFLTSEGAAYVDLSPDVAIAHTGGTLDELLTVYTIVNALTANLPAITAVQLVVDGKEVPTLSGHVDLRRPLAKNLAWVQ